MKWFAYRGAKRNTLALVPWAGAYLIAVGLIGANLDPPAWWLAPLSIPLCIALVHLFYPSVLTQIVVFAITLAYTVQLLYATIRYEGEIADTEGTVLNWIFIGYLILVLALLWGARGARGRCRP